MSGIHFLGLPFSTLATYFAIAGAAVLGLYILKLRRRPVPVPFSPLWQRILRDKEATSLFSRLKRLLSLLLQLLLLALLVLALGDPRKAVEEIKGRNLVVLVDTSASMQAIDVEKGKSRIDLAKEQLHTMVKGLGASDRMLVASMDALVTPLSPMTGDTARLDTAIDSLRAVDCRADLPRALRFATDTLRNVKESEIVVVSDGVLGDARDGLGAVKLGDAKLSYIPIGEGKRNVAITQFSVRRYPLDKSRYEVMIEVRNLGDRDEDVEIDLYGDGELIDVGSAAIHLRAPFGPVAQNGPGPAVSPTGAPDLTGDQNVVLTITTPGKLGTSFYSYKVGTNPPTTPAPTDSAIAIPELGVKVRLPFGDYAAGTTYSFDVHDSKYQRFTPNMSGANRTLEARVVLPSGQSCSTPGGDCPKGQTCRGGACFWQDDLPADDRAFGVLPARHKTKILAVTTGNTYLEAALLLDEYLDVTEVSPDRMATALQSGKYDVAIYDGITPPLTPGLPAFYMDPKTDGGPVKVGAEIATPSFDTLGKHPILRWTALDAVGISVAHKLTPGEGDKVVGASSEGPILVAGQRGGTKFVAMGFDVKQSDFPLRIAWPVFLLNTINWFVDEDADYLSSFKTGEVWHVPAPLGATNRVILTDPTGGKHVVPVQEGRAVFFGNEEGFYKLQLPEGVKSPLGDDQPRPEVVFAANLADPAVSAIDPWKELGVDGQQGGQVQGFHAGVRSELWIYLLVAAAVITAVEWTSYHRRVTV